MVPEVFLDYFLPVMENEPFRLSAFFFSHGEKIFKNTFWDQDKRCLAVTKHKTENSEVAMSTRPKRNHFLLSDTKNVSEIFPVQIQNAPQGWVVQSWVKITQG